VTVTRNCCVNLTHTAEPGRAYAPYRAIVFYDRSRRPRIRPMRNYRIALVHHRPFPREEGRGAFASPPLPPLRARRLTPCAASADSFFRQRSGDSRSISRTASLAGFNFAKWLAAQRRYSRGTPRECWESCANENNSESRRGSEREPIRNARLAPLARAVVTGFSRGTTNVRSLPPFARSPITSLREISFQGDN
jgi:hypothetical protein